MEAIAKFEFAYKAGMSRRQLGEWLKLYRSDLEKLGQTNINANTLNYLACLHLCDVLIIDTREIYPGTPVEDIESAYREIKKRLNQNE